MHRTATTLVAFLALLLLVAAPAAAQDPYPPVDDDPEATVSQTVVVAGQPVTVSGNKWLPGSQVTIEFLSTPVLLATAQVDATGRFSTQVTIPRDATPGPHTIRVTGLDFDRNQRTVNLPIIVQAAAAAPPVSTPAAPPAVTPRAALARTGGHLTTGGAFAVLFLVVGGGALFASRRLSRAHA
jgi:hypothetical protein